MHLDYWQRTVLSDSPRAENHSLAFRADQERWLAPRIEDRWVLLRAIGPGIARGAGARPSCRIDEKRARRDRPG